MSNDTSAAHNFVSRVGVIASGLNRKGIKTRILIGLGVLYIGWLCWSLSQDIYGLTLTIDQYNPYPFFFWEDFWGLLPGLLLGFLVRNPFAWLNGKRLVFGCIAFAMILGRLVSGGLTGLLLNYMQVGAGTAFWAMPFSLVFAGLGVILAVGFLAVFVFGVFVAIPAAISNRYSSSSMRSPTALGDANPVANYRYQTTKNQKEIYHLPRSAAIIKCHGCHLSKSH